MKKNHEKWQPDTQKLAQLERLKNNQTLYQVNDRISWEEFHLLRELPRLTLHGLFPPTKAKDTFGIEYICQECGALCHESKSKSVICNQMVRPLCPKCLECEEKQEKERQKQAAAETLEWLNKNKEECWGKMLDFINPNMSWNKQLKPYEWWGELNQCYLCLPYEDRESLSEMIQELVYDDFLQTPYWKAISAHAKYLARYRCALCSQKKHLITHHKTYEHHGREIEFLQDLIVLCDDCHCKFHEIGE